VGAADLPRYPLAVRFLYVAIVPAMPATIPNFNFRGYGLKELGLRLRGSGVVVLHLANGNKNVAGYSRVSFFKNFVSRGSQGFVGQSSPNVAYIAEKPSVLNKFFSELQYSAAFGRESRKFAGGV